MLTEERLEYGRALGAHPFHWSERKRERCRICPELLFLFLQGMIGALAPFSYLVFFILVDITFSDEIL